MQPTTASRQQLTPGTVRNPTVIQQVQCLTYDRLNSLPARWIMVPLLTTTHQTTQQLNLNTPRTYTTPSNHRMGPIPQNRGGHNIHPNGI